VIEHIDVAIVGAGLSGVAAAYHLQTLCPAKTYAILEARATLGGTWDLFRYPGVRSDSDMFTLGYSFRPWKDAKAIADGDAILAYIRDTAAAFGIDRHIRYDHRVTGASWTNGRWTLDVAGTQLTCSFLILCSGYYDYAAGYTPELPGRERFAGRIVHPQQWTPDIEYAGKRVVVIGSGATAVTLVPELAKRAAHVTMLQRSPTYILSRPARDPIADWLRAHLPERTAHAIARWKNVLLGMAFFNFSRRFPERAARMLVKQVEHELHGSVAVEPHFTPHYNVWDQRLCLVPDGDLFAALRDGRASVVTDHIATFDATGIALRSGQHLDADLVVTATGLRLRFFGGIAIRVDGRVIEPHDLLVYKGVMCSGVPNLAFAAGYTNASWTLKADLTAQYVARLLAYMDRHGYTWCCPRRDPAVHDEPIIDFTSGYVQRALDRLPRQGDVRPWKLFQNYALDLLLIRHSRIADRAMEFG
jgi:cation diffusion facilitator CzcD-associated flavoprotein CzcO